MLDSSPQIIPSVVSPALQPNSKLTATPGPVIDAKSFPHIFDQIVAAAPYDSLLRLRGTSTTMKDRVDAQIMRHVHARHRFSWVEYTTTEGRRLPALYVEEYEDPPVHSLSLVRVLDIGRPKSLYGYRNTRGILRPDTLRTYEDGDTPMLDFQDLEVRRHIHFTSTALETDEEMVISPHLRKLVINLLCEPGPHVWNQDYISIRPESYQQAPCVEDLVVILGDAGSATDDCQGVCCRRTPLGFGNAFHWPIYILAFTLWKFGPLRRLSIVHTFQSSERVFLSENVRRKIAEEIELVEIEAVFPVLNHDVDEFATSIEFIDLETYRARVGDEELRLELDRSLFGSRP